MRNSGSGVCGIEFFVKTKSDWNVSGMSQKFRLMLRKTVVISSQYASCLLYFLNKIGSYHHGSAQPESLGMWHFSDTASGYLNYQRFKAMASYR